MKYVPSLPPPVSGIEDWRQNRALAAVRRTRPVEPRTLPPLLILPRHPPPEEVVQPVPPTERRKPEQESRRKVCRRVLHQPMLEELRSGVERRHSRQRGDDDAEHIDEEA